VTVELETTAGTEHAFELAARPVRADGERQAGDWAIAVDAETVRDCGPTVTAIAHAVGEVAALEGAGDTTRTALERLLTTLGVQDAAASNWALLAVLFGVLVAGTLGVLVRKTRARRPSSEAKGE